jgi:hypothetical protein
MLLGCSHDLVADYRKKLSAPAIEEPTEQGKIETATYQKGNVHNASPILDMQEIEQLATDLCKNIKSLTMEEAMVLSILWDLQAFPESSALGEIVRNTMPTQPDEEDFTELIEDFIQSCYIGAEGYDIWLTEEGQKEILSTLNKRTPTKSPEPQTTQTTKTEKPAQEQSQEPPKPKHKPGSTLDKAREILADRIVEEPMRAFRLPGRQREIYLLAVIVGIDSNGLFEWTDGNLDEAELAFAQGLAKRTAQELKRGNECIGTLSSIALIWDLDPNAIMILAERATK